LLVVIDRNNGFFHVLVVSAKSQYFSHFNYNKHLSEILKCLKYSHLERFILVILAYNATPVSEDTKNGIIFTTRNCRKQNMSEISRELYIYIYIYIYIVT